MLNLLPQEKVLYYEDNNLCPCNSGKDFNQCCKNKKNEYRTLGKNFLGIDIIFNHTKTMEIYDNIANYAIEKIFSLEGQPVLSISKSISILNHIYTMVDEGMEEFIEYAPCKKGCSSCCSLYLDCTAIEAENIRRHLVENASSEYLDQLTEKLNYMKNNLDTTKRPYELTEEQLDKLYLEYALKSISCMFLNKEGACSIYKVRPLSCRKFIVFSSREYCKSKISEIVKPNLAPVNIGTLAVHHLSMSTGRYKNLIYIDNGEKQPIRRPLIQWFIEDFKDINREI